MLIFVATYLVLSSTLGVVLGRMIRYGTSDPVRRSNQADILRTRIFARSSESHLHFGTGR